MSADPTASLQAGEKTTSTRLRLPPKWVPLTHTGNGSAPSWMTKPSITCVRTCGLTMAWGGLLSPLCGATAVTPGASLSFPEVMGGGGLAGAGTGLLVAPPPERQMTQQGTLLKRRKRFSRSSSADYKNVYTVQGAPKDWKCHRRSQLFKNCVLCKTVLNDGNHYVSCSLLILLCS